MLAVALAILTAPAPSRASALAWADRHFQANREGWVDQYYGEALEAYRAIRRRYGPTPFVNRRLAQCLTQHGSYQEALSVLGSRRSPEARDLSRRIRVKAAVQAELDGLPRRRVGMAGRHVLQVEPLLGGRGWAVLVAKPRLDTFKSGEGEDQDTFNRMFYENASLFVVSSDGGRVVARCSVATNGRHNDNDGYESIGLAIRTVKLGARDGVTVWTDYLGGDSGPNELNVFELRPHGLKHVGRFWGEREPELLSNGLANACAVEITTTWKVWWPDVYLWSGGAFRVANQEFPKQYPWEWLSEFGRTRLYFDWEVRAAVYAIHRDWKSAAASLRRAEYRCRGAIRSQKKDPKTMDDQFPDYGFYGDTDDNLIDIRRRLRWIARHDYNHPLLYRPYDFDLQVPPYKLGHAGDGR